MSQNKYAVSDELWEKIQAFIPPRVNTHPRGGGRKPKDDRAIFEAILFVLRFGCRWDALNATSLAPSSTVHDRFRKWEEAGLFHRLRDEGLLDLEIATKGIDWKWLDVGSARIQDKGRRRSRWQENRGAATERYRPSLGSVVRK